MTDCCVVGGGPSGLLLALLLGRHGLRVSMVEAKAGFPPPGAGPAPTLHPPTLELLRHAGLLDRLDEVGERVEGSEEYGPDGLLSSWTYAELPGAPLPYALKAHLGTLCRVLLDEIDRTPGVRVHTGVTVRGLDDAGDDAFGLDTDDPEVPARPRWLVAADGKFSALREAAGITADVLPFERPYLRVVVPAPADRPTLMRTVQDPPSYLFTTPNADGTVVVMWSGSRADVDAVRGRPDLLAEHVGRLDPDLGRHLAAGAPGPDDVLEIAHHTVLPHTLHARNLVLLGDAAHGMHSLGGQGLNLSVHDAVLLADLLGHPDRPDPLATYERIRRPYVRRFQLLQRDVGALTWTDDTPAVRPLHEGMVELMTAAQAEVAALAG